MDRLFFISSKQFYVSSKKQEQVGMKWARGKKKKHFDVQVHFVLRHGQYIFSHSLDTLHVLKRVARRLCRSVQPPSLQIKTCADKNRSSGRQASPTHSSILPIRASPSACLVCRVLLKGTLTKVLKWRQSPFFSLLSVFFHMTEYAAPGATWHDEGNK